jgi:hypothetical protein
VKIVFDVFLLRLSNYTPQPGLTRRGSLSWRNGKLAPLLMAMIKVRLGFAKIP